MVERTLGRIRGAEAGPTVIVLAGIHGNEPAGVPAARQVLERLGEHPDRVRGEVLALAGNRAGLSSGERFVDKDLNRLWLPERIEALRSRGTAHTTDSEDRELLELLEAIDAAVARSRGAVVVADLHTTSAAGVPFVLFGDGRKETGFLTCFPIPTIVGLSRLVAGAAINYFSRRGCITFAVEGGRHADLDAIDNLAAAVWVALAHAECIAAAEWPEVQSAHRLLDVRRDGLPHVLEVASRHAIGPEDDFAMEAGFRNLHAVSAGQLLARDRRGEIRAPEDGVVILPLYQKLGTDGFFWGRATTTPMET